jgi:hypothetical protein
MLAFIVEYAPKIAKKNEQWMSVNPVEMRKNDGVETEIPNEINSQLS